MSRWNQAKETPENTLSSSTLYLYGGECQMELNSRELIWRHRCVSQNSELFYARQRNTVV
jgi:hypothetical protein